MLKVGAAFVILLTLPACVDDGKHVSWPGVNVPSMKVGSIVVEWNVPSKTTWVCSGVDNPANLSTAKTVGTSGSTKSAEASLTAKVAGWLTAKGSYKTIDTFKIHLADGWLEAAPLESLHTNYRELNANCQGKIGDQHTAGARYFRVATKIYRGTLVIDMSFKREATAEAKVDEAQKFAVEVGGSIAEGSDSKVTVEGGVWILESEPLANPPA
jgi:hypothetical protein